MATSVYLKPCPGQFARCRICNERIKKGQMMICWESFNSSARVHRNKQDCIIQEEELAEEQKWITNKRNSLHLRK